MKNKIISFLKPVVKGVVAIGLAIGLSTAAQAQNYIRSQPSANMSGFVLGKNSGTNAVFDKYQLGYGGGGGQFAFQTSITGSNAGNSNVVFGLKFSIDPDNLGWADAITWVTNNCNGSNVTVRTINLINSGQSRYAMVATNFTTQTNDVTISYKFGQHRQGE